METAGIVDLVVNCMALTFVLDIDEMCFNRLATAATKHMLEELEDLPLFDVQMEEGMTDQQVVERYERDEFGSGRWKIFSMVLPKRLLTILGLMVLFICKYYYFN